MTSKKPAKSRAWIAGACALLSAALLIWASTQSDEVARPVVASDATVERVHAGAAAAAGGRRVLVLEDRPPAAVSGAVFESARGAEGWALYDAVPPGADDVLAGLTALSSDAAAQWKDGRRFDDDLVSRLARACVAVVVVVGTDGAVAPEVAETHEQLAPLADPKGLRVRGAEPLWRVEDATSMTPESVLDYSDGLWGASFTISADVSSTYWLPWGVEGASVTLNEEPFLPRPADGAGPVALPGMQIDVPRGMTRVQISYVDAALRAWFAVVGALGLTFSLLWLLRIFRPLPEADRPSSD